MSQLETVKAIIADDHPLFRAALRQAVNESLLDGDISEAKCFVQLTELVEQQPDVELIFLDLNMPGNDGFSGLSQLRNTHPDILVIVVSALEEDKIIRKAIDLGASAYIPKSASLSVITLAIEHVLNGEIWTPEGFDYEDSSSESSEEQELASKLEKLSPAQFKVLQMIADGLLNKQIAYELKVQETTIKQHVTAILQKLGVNNRTQAGIIFQQLKQIS
jgi:DNA-binding NarL/FixJ family response regulator